MSFSNQERFLLLNMLLDRDAALPYMDGLREVAKRLSISDDLSPQDIGVIQYLLREQIEINSQHSVANEKDLRGPGTRFFPHSTMLLIKSISDKLGAKLPVDTTSMSDPHSGRQEGSTWIMTSPIQKPICG